MRRLLPTILVWTALVMGAPPAIGQGGPTGAPAWRPLPQALAVARASRVPALIYVQASWCGPCRRFERETLAAPAVRDRLAQMALARLTVDDHDRGHRIGPYRLSEAAWAARLGAAATPTLVLLGPDGTVLGRHAGVLPAAGLVPLLDAALTDAAQAPPSPSHR